MEGSQIQGFVVKHKIGEGGMADVYYAENSLGLPAAVKVLKNHLSLDASLRLRFEQEARLMARLSHPGIRKVLDIHSIANRPAILMEYLSGEDMGSYVKKRGPVPSLLAELLWKQAFEAISFAHSQGVIHRDIKPSNFFLTDEGELKLLDFGIAKVEDQLGHTLTGQQMGTVLYMSPEQIKDPKRVDKATDYYSLGVTFYHFLTGSAPYDLSTASNFQIQLRIVQEPLDLGMLPSKWQGILAACLHKNSNNRVLYEKPGDAPALQVRSSSTPLDETVLQPVVNEELPATKSKPPSAKGFTRDKTTFPSSTVKRSKRPVWLVAAIVLVTGCLAMLYLLGWPKLENVPPVADGRLIAFKSPQGLWGYNNSLGKEVIPAVYDSAGVFVGDEALVKKGVQRLWIANTGEVLRVLVENNDVAAVADLSTPPATVAEPEITKAVPVQEVAVQVPLEEDADEEVYVPEVVTEDRVVVPEQQPQREKPVVPSADMDDKAWQKAIAGNTPAAYQAYLNAFPYGKHAIEGRQRLAVANEKAAWTKAVNWNTKDGYKNYIKAYPQGPNVADANDRIGLLLDQEQWNKVKGSRDPEVFRNFVKSHPKSRFVQEATQQMAMLEEEASWRKAKSSGKAADIEAYLASYRDGRYAEEAKRSLKTIKPSITPNQLKQLEANMIFVQGGTFQMGCTQEQGRDCAADENPVHEVTLPSYYISKFEVTQEEWLGIMGTNPSEFAQCNKCPVERISWLEIQEFVKRLNELTGKSYRLPSEAEWEYAARGGNKSMGYKYSGSQSVGDVAWFDQNSGKKTHPVGTKLPNELGLYDMSGNVREWCQDFYGPYSASSVSNPKGPSKGTLAVIRGGSWYSFNVHCRVTLRYQYGTSLRGNTFGFRLARSYR